MRQEYHLRLKSIPIRKIFHELRALIKQRIGYIRKIQQSFYLGYLIEMLLVHPLFQTNQNLGNQFRTMRIKGTTHLNGISTDQQTFHGIFPIMYSGRRRDTDSRYFTRYDCCPPQCITQIQMAAENISGNELQLIQIDIRLKKTIEQNNAICAIDL